MAFFEPYILSGKPYRETLIGQAPAAPEPAAPAPEPAAAEPGKLIEVCRSFAYKLNCQNHGGEPYESADFFASRKIQCEREAVELVSQEIFEECVMEVRGAIEQFKAILKQKRQAKELSPGVDPAAHRRAAVSRPQHPAAATNQAEAYRRWSGGSKDAEGKD